MLTAYLYQFYADYYAFAASAGLERAITLFKGINVVVSTDTNTIDDPVNAVSAIQDFSQALDVAYEYLWLDGQNISPIQVSFLALADWVKHETGLSINDYLTQEELKVSSTYASISNVIGEVISNNNIR